MRSLPKKLAVVAGVLLLVALMTVACSAPAAPTIVKETVIVEKPVEKIVEKAVPQTVVVEKPVPQTVVAQPTAAPKPTEAPKAPEAVLQIIEVPGYANDKNAITATVKYVTDTVVGEKSSVAALYTSGLGNVPIKVPVHLQVSAVDVKMVVTPTWSLSAKPDGSKAAITRTKDIMVAEFTPDVVGAYQVSVSLKNAAGLTSESQVAFVNAGTYIGVTAGKCETCHPAKAAEWAKTPHAMLFSEELDNQVDGPLGVKPVGGFITHYSETCTRCHTTGCYPAPYNGSGGYWDAKAAANWTFPTWKQIDGVFLKTDPSNWEAAPAAVKNMGTIGCEMCHGPAGEHVKNGAKVMEASFDAGVCDQCHGAAANHSKGWQLAYSGHGDESSPAWEIAGPGEQGCVRCHTAGGFASFLQNPTNQAAWDNKQASLSCAGCHDPHSDANAYQLRIVSKPIAIPFEAKKDVGLSAVCFECHNARRSADDFAAGKTTSYPHYSSAAEMLTDLGGVTYGETLPNSPHGMMVGAAPIPNPAYDGKDTAVAPSSCSPRPAKPRATSLARASSATCGRLSRSPMTDTLAYKVGGHSFNTVTPDGKIDYGASCKSCHGDINDFNLKAKADYDGNGKVEGVQDEVKGLLNMLWKGLEAKGVKKVDTGNPYATIPSNADAKVKNAWFNFRFVYGVMWGPDTGNGNEGKAAAIHNFKRTVALLQHPSRT